MDYSYLTKERLEELKKELEELKTTRRIEIAERLKVAKEAGDLSENSEYFEAREEQARIESRIVELGELIKNSIIIAKSKQHAYVKIGSTAKVKKGNEVRKLTIVGSTETDPANGLISNKSPLGKALLGKKAGESAMVETPSGEVLYKIVSID